MNSNQESSYNYDDVNKSKDIIIIVHKYKNSNNKTLNNNRVDIIVVTNC